MKEQKIANFEKLGLGMFVHFGLFSMIGKGEWYFVANEKPDLEMYSKLPSKFKVDKNWAKKLVKNAKEMGAKYITITTRHHDGYSLFDAKNLSDYSTVKSPIGRDLIKEFCDECHKQGIVPFLYHTLLDWQHPDYKNNFDRYVQYLLDSVELLCKNYGEIGGFWFDGYWDNPGGNWRFDELVEMIHKYQPNALVINNTGLSKTGEVSHKGIDVVTFERGKTMKVHTPDRDRAGEMCETLNDHWGYCKNDINFKTVPMLIDELMECRFNNCNMLLNTGLKGNGLMNGMDHEILSRIGQFLKFNKNILDKVTGTDVKGEDFLLFEDEKNYYVYCKNVPMNADPNVQLGTNAITITLPDTIKIKNAKWLDNGKKAKFVSKDKHSFTVEPFIYGNSFRARFLKFSK